MRKGSAAKRFRSLLQGLFCAGFLTMFPPGLTAEEEQRPQETARIDLVSLPKAAENLSRLGDAVAPEFPLSVFAATAFLGMAQPAMLMDVTKPFSIRRLTAFLTVIRLTPNSFAISASVAILSPGL